MTTIPTSNLPVPQIQDSAESAKRFFNSYYEESISFPANTIDAAIGFFESRGFEKTAAVSVSSVLLAQSKAENVNVFQLLDTLKGLNELQLSRVVSEILNYNRVRISTLGYREDNPERREFDQRNTMA
jgi:hypothetical protein